MIKHLIMLLLLFHHILYSQRDIELKGFRDSPFGSTPTEVKSKETASSLQSFTGWGIYALSFEGWFAGIEARIDYTFFDNKLIEGSYILEPEEGYYSIFSLCRKEITEEFGKPDSWAVSLIEEDNIWKEQNKYGLYDGPQLFWLFSKGFIVLHSSKFKDKITLTVLFSCKEGLDHYNAEVLLKTNNPE